MVWFGLLPLEEEGLVWFGSHALRKREQCVLLLPNLHQIRLPSSLTTDMVVGNRRPFGPLYLCKLNGFPLKGTVLRDS